MTADVFSYRRARPAIRGLLLAGLAATLTVVPASAAWAQDQGKTPAIDKADTAWVLLGAALVLLMTPALAFFYGGLVRRKNILSVLMQCLMLMCLISVQWIFFGYSLAFGPDHHGLIGDFSWLGLSGVGVAPNPDYADTVPQQAFMIFQCMFAIITPGLIIGAFAERIRFAPFCIFSLLWATIVYDPIAHWVWGHNGFLAAMGVKDFAGGIVVHVNAGMCALAAALFLGRRHGYPTKISPPHSLPFAVLGAGLLWFGWFGFNAGSALKADGLATSAFVATHAAGAVAGLVWALCDWAYFKRSTVLGMITGAIAGLAAVTPAAGFVGPLPAAAIGVLAGAICWLSVTFIKTRLGYDDSLDAFGVHGVGGIIGSLAVGLWASTAINPAPAGADGLFYGHAGQLGTQAVGVLICGAYSFGVSLILFKVVDLVFKLRVSEKDERIGLDLTQHREVGYTMID